MSKFLSYEDRLIISQRIQENASFGAIAKELGKDCPFPQKRASCLSAFCVKVDALAEYCKIPYYCEGEVAFFSILFFQQK